MKYLLRKSSSLSLLLLLAFTLLASAQDRTTPEGNAPAANQQQPTTDASRAAAHGESAKEAEHQEAEHEENAEFKYSGSVQWLAQHMGISTAAAYWLSILLNFGVVLALIIWGMRAGLPGVFRDRTAAIQRGMEEARKASAEANLRLSEIEARLAKLGEEIGGMQARAEQDAIQEEQRLRQGTEEEVRKIVQAAEQEIAAAGNQARRELKQFAADLAVNLAEKRLTVTDAQDRELVREFAGNLDGAGKGNR